MTESRVKLNAHAWKPRTAKKTRKISPKTPNEITLLARIFVNESQAGS